MAQDKRQDIDLGIVRFEYGEAARSRRAVLEIATRKHYNGGLISDATVYWVGDHSRQNCMSLGGNGGDYNYRLRVTPKDMRATQKNIDLLHAQVFGEDVVAGLVRAAKAHYASVVAAGSDGFGNTYPTVEAVAK